MNATLPSTNTENQYEKWFVEHPKLGVSLMMHLYNRLDGAYPHWWHANFSGQQSIDNWAASWAEAFEEEGITPADIKVGLKACRTKYDSPPSCAQFIKACRPTADPTRAYYEAVSGVQARAKGEMGAWSHPAIYWAAMPLAFDLGNQTYSQIRPRWERALAEQMDRGEWAAIPEPMLALPEPGKGVLSKESAAKMLEELGAADVAKTACSPADHKRWARIIIERVKKPHHGLSSLQIKFAKEALEIA